MSSEDEKHNQCLIVFHLQWPAMLSTLVGMGPYGKVYQTLKQYIHEKLGFLPLRLLKNL